MWSEPLAHGRQNAHHSCPAGRDLRGADPSTRGATAPQRAQRVNFVGRRNLRIYIFFLFARLHLYLRTFFSKKLPAEDASALNALTRFTAKPSTFVGGHRVAYQQIRHHSENFLTHQS